MGDQWDVIRLRGLSTVANHGVFKFERESGQTFTVDLTLFFDASTAAETDDLADTINYASIADEAVAILQGSAVNLLETLASAVAAMALDHPGVVRAEATVHKPMAPIRHQFQDVSVTVVREREAVVGKEVRAVVEMAADEVTASAGELESAPEPVSPSDVELASESDLKDGQEDSSADVATDETMEDAVSEEAPAEDASSEDLPSDEETVEDGSSEQETPEDTSLEDATSEDPTVQAGAAEEDEVAEEDEAEDDAADDDAAEDDAADDDAAAEGDATEEEGEADSAAENGAAEDSGVEEIVADSTDADDVAADRGDEEVPDAAHGSTPKPETAESPFPKRAERTARRLAKHAAMPEFENPYPTRRDAQGRPGAKRFERHGDRPGPGHVYDVVLALGSNRGDVVGNLAGAVAALVAHPQFEVLDVSPLVRTKPVLEPGALPQADYQNAIVLGKTTMIPPTLLEATQQIEADFGRVRGAKWSARSLDIDIIAIDEMQFHTRSLTVPHHLAHKRAFVLYPWSLLDEDAEVPGRGSVAELLGAASDLGGVKAITHSWLSEEEGGTLLEEPLSLSAEAPQREDDAAVVEEVVIRGSDIGLRETKEDPLFRRLLSKERAATEEAVSAPVQNEAEDEPTTSGDVPPSEDVKAPEAEAFEVEEAEVDSVDVAEPDTTRIPRVVPVSPPEEAAESVKEVGEEPGEAELPQEEADAVEVVEAAEAVEPAETEPAEPVEPEGSQPEDQVESDEQVEPQEPGLEAGVESDANVESEEPTQPLSGSSVPLPDWDFYTQSRSVRIVEYNSGENGGPPPVPDVADIPSQAPRVNRTRPVRPTPSGSEPVKRRKAGPLRPASWKPRS